MVMPDIIIDNYTMQNEVNVKQSFEACASLNK